MAALERCAARRAGAQRKPAIALARPRVARAILEEVMLDVMFEVPRRGDIREFHVTKAMVTAQRVMLEKAAPGALDHCVAGHQSAEGAHARLLEKLGKEPLLALGLRLGEGSGAALAIGVVQGAVACHSGMATFAEAGVAAG